MWELRLLVYSSRVLLMNAKDRQGTAMGTDLPTLGLAYNATEWVTQSPNLFLCLPHKPHCLQCPHYSFNLKLALDLPHLTKKWKAELSPPQRKHFSEWSHPLQQHLAGGQRGKRMGSSLEKGPLAVSFVHSDTAPSSPAYICIPCHQPR